MSNIVMFDGPDGIGKSTLVDAVCAHYDQCVLPAKKLSFPTGELKDKAKSGKILLTAREFLLDIAGGLSSAVSMHRRIICDRSFLATMAYQGCTTEFVKHHLPPALLDEKFNSITLFRLYMAPEKLAERISSRADDVAIGLEGAAGISEKRASVDSLSRLDERFRMATEMIGDMEPWKSSHRFRIIPVDMGYPPSICVDTTMSLLDNLMF